MNVYDIKSDERVFVNGTFQVLALESNNLIGSIRNDLTLVRSLTYLDLDDSLNGSN
jgi:hypothetical protein